MKPLKTVPMIAHPVSVRCLLPLPLTELQHSYLITGAGDKLRTYDISDLEEPELLSEIDAHAHDVTSLACWVQRGASDSGKPEWIVSGSLDGTIRKWRLSGTASSVVSLWSFYGAQRQCL